MTLLVGANGQAASDPKMMINNRGEEY